MVVIAIVALLAAVAVPAYGSYTIKARVASVLPILDDIGDVVLNQYAQGEDLPASIQYGGITIADGNTELLSSIPGITHILYMTTVGNPNIPADAFVTCVHVDVDVSSGGTRVCKGMNLDTIIQATCGQWDATPADLNLEYLPGTCQDVVIDEIN